MRKDLHDMQYLLPATSESGSCANDHPKVLKLNWYINLFSIYLAFTVKKIVERKAVSDNDIRQTKAPRACAYPVANQVTCIISTKREENKWRKGNTKMNKEKRKENKEEKKDEEKVEEEKQKRIKKK